MAVKIRMKRTGAKNDASFRVVAADARSPRDGKNLETLGWYTPAAKGKIFELNLGRIDYWLGEGAQISDTVASLVKKARKAPTAAVAGTVAAAVVEPVAPVAVALETEAAVEAVPAADAN